MVKRNNNKQLKMKQDLEKESWDEEREDEEGSEEEPWDEEEAEDEEDSEEDSEDEEELEDEEDLEEDPEDEEELEDEEDPEEDSEDEEELEDEEDSEEDPEDEEELEDEEDSEEDPEDEESTEIENGQNKRKKNKKCKHKKSKLGKETKKHKANKVEAKAESVVVKKNKTKDQVSEIAKEALQDFDSTRYKPLNIQMHTRSVGKAGAASIINSPKNGKRFTISKKTMVEIGNPKAVKIAVSKNKIAISAAEEDSSEALKLGRIGAKGVIYSADLVEKLTEEFELDFSNRVSITFDKVEYTVDGDQIVAEITMR